MSFWEAFKSKFNAGGSADNEKPYETAEDGYRDALKGFDSEARAGGSGMPDNFIRQWRAKMNPKDHQDLLDGVEHFMKAEQHWEKRQKKTAEATKGELKSLLLSHEKRETKEQEAAESPKEQKLEAKVGLHEDHEEKKAFWRGFEKRRG